MASLQITIEIDEQPLTGHQHKKLEADHGQYDAAILSRIVKSNAGEYGPNTSCVDVVLKSLCAAVTAAEAAVIPV